MVQQLCSACSALRRATLSNAPSLSSSRKRSCGTCPLPGHRCTGPTAPSRATPANRGALKDSHGTAAWSHLSCMDLCQAAALSVGVHASRCPHKLCLLVLPLQHPVVTACRGESPPVRPTVDQVSCWVQQGAKSGITSHTDHALLPCCAAACQKLHPSFGRWHRSLHVHALPAAASAGFQSHCCNSFPTSYATMSDSFPPVLVLQPHQQRLG